jgi:hypothetical protein
MSDRSSADLYISMMAHAAFGLEPVASRPDRAIT